MRIPILGPSCQHLLFLIFLMIAILTVWGNISLWFWYAFPWWLDMLNTCLLGYVYVFFGKMRQRKTKTLFRFPSYVLQCCMSFYISLYNLNANPILNMITPSRGVLMQLIHLMLWYPPDCGPSWLEAGFWRVSFFPTWPWCRLLLSFIVEQVFH